MEIEPIETARHLAPGTTERAVERVGAPAGAADPGRDVLAVEEPLEIRIDGEILAITMRTPGEDARLVVGFLYGEHLIRSIDDLAGVAHCGRPGEAGWGNVIDARPAPGVAVDIGRVLDSRRFTITSAACGVCGRRTIEDLLRRAAALPVQAGLLARAELARTVEGLRALQPNFARTGGIHAAAVFGADGTLLTAREDIGRHNAVDKAVGDLLYRRILGAPGAAAAGAPAPVLLVVSGRASFEILQKACVARIPIVASVSAVSSLAVDLAQDAGITLAGFVRAGRLSVYTHPERLG